MAMDRRAAATLLGVDPGAEPVQVDRAFRARVRERHPDQFPPGSQAHSDAERDLRALLEARDVLGAAAPAPLVHDVESGAWVWAADLPPRRADEWFLSARDADRHLRRRALAWGLFLVLASGASVAIATASGHTDGLVIWAPALCLTGLVSITIGLVADRRLRR
jgi:hypothetical protein